MGALTFKCPNCGGELIFSPATQKYQCEYCDSLFTQKELDAMAPVQGQTWQDEEASQTEGQQAGTTQHAGGSASEGSSASAAAGAAGSGDAAAIYSCPSCGAEIVTDPTTAATFCYYCHTPVVLTGRLEGKYLPDSVIPFKIDRETARKRFGEFISRKKYVPKAFFSEEQMEKLTGVYYPYWVYDCEISGMMEADATRLRMWRHGDVEYTEHNQYQVDRAGSVELHELTRNALSGKHKELVEQVQPYRLEDLTDFSMGYLSGFQAERRNQEQETFQGSLDTETKGSAERIFRDTISGYSTVNVRQQSFQTRKSKWRYTLFPVWVLTYRGRGEETYYYAMNAQTGEVAGKLPVDYGKLLAHGGILGLVILILALIGGYLI